LSQYQIQQSKSLIYFLLSHIIDITIFGYVFGQKAVFGKNLSSSICNMGYHIATEAPNSISYESPDITILNRPGFTGDSKS